MFWILFQLKGVGNCVQDLFCFSAVKSSFMSTYTVTFKRIEIEFSSFPEINQRVILVRTQKLEIPINIEAPNFRINNP